MKNAQQKEKILNLVHEMLDQNKPIDNKQVKKLVNDINNPGYLSKEEVATAFYKSIKGKIESAKKQGVTATTVSPFVKKMEDIETVQKMAQDLKLDVKIEIPEELPCVTLNFDKMIDCVEYYNFSNNDIRYMEGKGGCGLHENLTFDQTIEKVDTIGVKDSLNKLIDMVNNDDFPDVSGNGNEKCVSTHFYTRRQKLWLAFKAKCSEVKKHLFGAYVALFVWGKRK